MSPTSLGALPNDLPAPLNRCQIKRGVSSADQGPYNNTVAQGTAITDGGGNAMQIAVIPRYRCWWLIRAEMIWRNNDAAWAYYTWYVALSPADLTGEADDWNHLCSHSALGWQTSVMDAAYLLEANTAYTATMRWGYSQGYNQYWYGGPEYLYIMGELVGEGQA